MKHPRSTVLFLALFVLALDQASKYVVRTFMEPAESISVLGDFFHVTYVRNLGAAYGLLPGRQELFIATAVFSLIGMLVYVIVWHPKDLLTVLGLGAAAGGTVGNLIDRVVAGRVTDFLDFFGRAFPVFNVADSAVVCGVAVLLIRILFWPEPTIEDEVTTEQPRVESGEDVPSVETVTEVPEAGGGSAASLDGTTS